MIHGFYLYQEEKNNVTKQLKFSKNLILSLYNNFPELTEGQYSTLKNEDIYKQQINEIYKSILIRRLHKENFKKLFIF